MIVFINLFGKIVYIRISYDALRNAGIQTEELPVMTHQFLVSKKYGRFKLWFFCNDMENFLVCAGVRDQFYLCGSESKWYVVIIGSQLS